MKKKLFTVCLICFLSFSFLPSIAQCITYYYFTAVKSGNCAANLEWKFQQCSDGKFFVQYSLTGSNFYTIAIINSTGGGGSDEIYQYTDNYACPATNPNDPVQYRILYLSNSGTQEISDIRTVDMGDACSCTNNNTTRCIGAPSININGSTTICNNASQTYTLSNSSYGATWSITSGSGLVSIISSNPSEITLSNSNSAGSIILSANIKGCQVISKTIIIGIPGPSGINMEFQSSCIGGSDWDASFAPSPILEGITYLWSINGSSYSSGLPYYNEHYLLGQSSDPSITLNIKYQNSCGTSNALTYPATYYSPCNFLRVSISPNPAKDFIDIIIDDPNKSIYSKKMLYSFEVNIFSKDLFLIKNQKNHLGSNTLRLNTSNLKAGLYFVQINNGTQKIVKQLIIQ